MNLSWFSLCRGTVRFIVQSTVTGIRSYVTTGYHLLVLRISIVLSRSLDLVNFKVLESRILIVKELTELKIMSLITHNLM